MASSQTEGSQPHLPRVPDSRRGHVTQFWLEREQEKPADKFSRKNLIHYWKCAKGGALGLSFSGSRAESGISGTEAAVSQLWSDEETCQGRWSRKKRAQILDELVGPLLQAWNICLQTYCYKHTVLLKLLSGLPVRRVPDGTLRGRAGEPSDLHQSLLRKTAWRSNPDHARPLKRRPCLTRITQTRHGSCFQ